MFWILKVIRVIRSVLKSHDDEELIQETPENYEKILIKFNFYYMPFIPIFSLIRFGNSYTMA